MSGAKIYHHPDYRNSNAELNSRRRRRLSTHDIIAVCWQIAQGILVNYLHVGLTMHVRRPSRRFFAIPADGSAVGAQIKNQTAGRGFNGSMLWKMLSPLLLYLVVVPALLLGATIFVLLYLWCCYFAPSYRD